MAIGKGKLTHMNDFGTKGACYRVKLNEMPTLDWCFDKNTDALLVF